MRTRGRGRPPLRAASPPAPPHLLWWHTAPPRALWRGGLVPYAPLERASRTACRHLIAPAPPLGVRVDATQEGPGKDLEMRVAPRGPDKCDLSSFVVCAGAGRCFVLCYGDSLSLWIASREDVSRVCACVRVARGACRCFASHGGGWWCLRCVWWGCRKGARRSRRAVERDERESPPAGSRRTYTELYDTTRTSTMFGKRATC